MKLVKPAAPFKPVCPLKPLKIPTHVIPHNTSKILNVSWKELEQGDLE